MHNLQITLTMQIDNDIYSALLNQQSSLSASILLAYVLHNHPEHVQVRSVAKVINGCK